MNWQDYFPHIFIPNLSERVDRFERTKEMLIQYGITATFWEATKHNEGKLGLVVTMKNIFKYCLEHGIERVLIFEDDCDIIVSPNEFNTTMDKCCDDLQGINWDLFYLGLQHPENFTYWVTPNLLRVTKGYSTHAVAYATNAMKFILSAHIEEPIDNFLVNSFQKHNTSYCSYPILCSQIAGRSDIYNDYIDWRPIIAPVFNKHVHDILDKRFK